MTGPLLEVKDLIKEYRERRFGPPTFRLAADCRSKEPTIVGVMGRARPPCSS